jgi:hypothetical protein
MHGNKVSTEKQKFPFSYGNQRQLYLGHRNKDQAASPVAIFFLKKN